MYHKKSKKSKGGGQKAIEQMVTDRIIKALESGTVPWHKPWVGTSFAPRNAVTKMAYRGINVWMCIAGGFGNPNFITIKQAIAGGWRIRFDEMKNSTPIVFWTFFDVEDKDTGEKKKIPFMRYYQAWNVEQLEGGVPEKFQVNVESVNDDEMNALCEQVCENYVNGPKVVEVVQDRAYYTPLTDTVTINPIDQFESARHYYVTKFHEYGHSTGHKSRLNREKASYAFEELVAEISAAILAAECSIDTTDIFDNSAAYIANWLKALSDDTRLVIKASQMAQKSVDCILGRKRTADGKIADETGEEKAA